MMENWKRFERLVAALHAAENRGAEVKWNDHIAGRQFDVVVRFDHGPYHYVTAIECRDLAGRVEVGDVEAFVTKSADARVDKAVMVSVKGFQAGALEAAARHGILLFTLDQIDDFPPGSLSAAMIPAARVHSIELQLETGEWLALPEDRNLPEFLAKHLTISVGGAIETLHEAIMRSELMHALTPQERMDTVDFGPGAVAYLPHLAGC